MAAIRWHLHYGVIRVAVTLVVVARHLAGPARAARGAGSRPARSDLDPRSITRQRSLSNVQERSPSSTQELSRSNT